MVSKRITAAGIRIFLAILVVGSVGGILLSQAKGSPVTDSASAVESTLASSMDASAVDDVRVGRNCPVI